MNARRGPASDPRAQDELKERAEYLRQRDVEDLRQLLKHEWGRRFLYRVVFGVCLVDARIYAASGQEMARNEGKREVGIFLKEWASDHATEAWIQAVAEQTRDAAEFFAANKQTVQEARARSTQ